MGDMSSNEYETVSSMVPAAVAEWAEESVDLEATQRISETTLALVRDRCRHGMKGESK
jgi:hypothetical protein